MDSNKFFAGTEVDRIDLEDGQWVDIKRSLTIGDQDALAQKLFDVEMTAFNREERRKQKHNGAQGVTARYKHSTVALLFVSITDWSFLNPDGSRVPLTEESLAKLRPDVANLIYEEIDKRNPLGVRSASQ